MDEQIYIDAKDLVGKPIVQETRASLLIQPPPGRCINLQRVIELINAITDNDIPLVEQELQEVIDKWIKVRA